VNELLAVYNLEFCGQGDTVVLWLVSVGEGGQAVDNALGVLKDMGCPHTSGRVPARVFSSDHRPFRRRGFRDVVTMSVVPSEAAEELRRFTASPWAALRLALRGRAGVPDFFRRIHNAKDTSEHLSEGFLALAREAIYRMIVALDRRPERP
jgi:hypothetical protein